MQRKTLILITSNFPYGARETYLEIEIGYLIEKFDLEG